MSKNTELERKDTLEIAAFPIGLESAQAKDVLEAQDSQQLELDLSMSSFSESMPAKVHHDGEELEGAFKDALDKFGAKIGKSLKKIEIVITEIAGTIQLIVNSEGVKMMFSNIKEATEAILEFINSGKLTTFLEVVEEMGGPMAGIASELQKHEGKITQIVKEINASSREIDKVVHSTLVDDLSKSLATQNYESAAAILVKSGAISQKLLLTNTEKSTTVIDSTGLHKFLESDPAGHQVDVSGHVGEHSNAHV